MFGVRSTNVLSRRLLASSRSIRGNSSTLSKSLATRSFLLDHSYPKHCHHAYSNNILYKRKRQASPLLKILSSQRQHRFLSSIPTTDLPVKILYASQGGTAQIFAMQLTEALEGEFPDLEVTTHGLDEGPPLELLQPGQALHVFLASTTGVGEPPDNARQFYRWLQEEADNDVLKGLDFCVFGLGNQKAHPNHYNVIGKGLHEKILALGGNPVYELGLGDDGECIEDDYDTWMENLMDAVYRGEGVEEGETAEEPEPAKDELAPGEEANTSTPTVDDPNITLEPCAAAKDASGTRRISAKYERLQLTPSDTDLSQSDLLHLETPFYQENTQALPVVTNRPLNANAGENGLFEMRVSLQGTGLEYETGDHIMVYPRNSEALVEGYLQHIDVDPHYIVEASEDARYPHPSGITVKETLQHAVDLSAVPPPNVARLLMGRKDIDYKNEIANPRRTVLDLLSSAPRKFALEEILYSLPPMKARYYSIASSNLVHPDEVFLVYRPVQYTSSQGHLRLGTCTSYLKNMMGREDAELDDYNTHDETASSHLIAAINSNPTFRLPEDRQTPVLFIAGGCGVAPIRAFLEERIQMVAEKSGPFGEGYLFLGFRSPADAPYKSLIQRAFQCGAISNLHITYNSGCSKGSNTPTLGVDDALRAHTSCGLVSDAVGEHGEQLYSFFERQGHTYICGGARLFGVAIENQVHLLLQNHGNLSENEATKYLQQMLEDGRFNEDLSD